ncbi:MAG: MSMEG_1061 family FMN-dependent PPOX-type flavoprotein [Chloroflexota bacterium]
MSHTHLISTKSELRALYGHPGKLPAAAKADKLDELCKQFINLSSFICISSCDSAGRQDVSPRGDFPGFVRVINDRTLAIPDRPGNNKLETLSNLLENPQVGLLFMIPGHDETLRLFGRASISCAPEYLAATAAKGKLPKSVILVEIDTVYPHCGKSTRRGNLWDASTYLQKGEAPSLAAIALKMAGKK